VARNLDYRFLGTSYFVCVDISDGDRGFSLFSDRSVIISEYFLSALMYTVVVLHHGDDYWLLMML
jgi:hypothetical protein